MRKLIAIGAGAVGAASVAVALVGPGAAMAAPDVSGQTYGQVKQMLSQSGATPIVATRSGAKVDEDSCIVDRIHPASGNPGTVYVHLNCYGGLATENSPGYSSQNPISDKMQ